jgi:hypothetical protein
VTAGAHAALRSEIWGAASPAAARIDGRVPAARARTPPRPARQPAHGALPDAGHATNARRPTAHAARRSKSIEIESRSVRTLTERPSHADTSPVKCSNARAEQSGALCGRASSSRWRRHIRRWLSPDVRVLAKSHPAGVPAVRRCGLSGRFLRCKRDRCGGRVVSRGRGSQTPVRLLHRPQGA